MTQIVLYNTPKVSDLLQICWELPSDEREQIEACTGRAYDADAQALSLAQRNGPSWVLCDESKPIAAAGFDIIRPGVYQDWMVNTHSAFDQHWRTTTKHVKRVMDAMLRTSAHRLQCVSLRSRVQAHAWYRVLGYREGGLLEAYGANGEDFLMFYRLKVWEDGVK